MSTTRWRSRSSTRSTTGSRYADLHRRTQRAAGGHGHHLRHRRRYAAERHRVARQRSGRRDLTFTITSAAASGTVARLTGGTFTYTPDPDFNGSDSFAFEVFDGEFTVGATVTITVNPVNDPPVVTILPIEVDEDGSAVGTVIATDVDEGDTLTFSVTTPPANGQVSPIDPDTGIFTYTPNPDFNGTDTFTVTVGDTTVDVTVTVNVSVTAVADAPVAHDANIATGEDTPTGGTLTATDADGDPLSYSIVTGSTNGTAVVSADGTFSYTPNLNFNGSDFFTFRANDGGLDSNTATVFISIAPVNDPPTAADAGYEALENTPLNGSLVGYDIDGEPSPSRSRRRRFSEPRWSTRLQGHSPTHPEQPPRNRHLHLCRHGLVRMQRPPGSSPSTSSTRFRTGTSSVSRRRGDPNTRSTPVRPSRSSGTTPIRTPVRSTAELPPSRARD